MDVLILAATVLICGIAPLAVALIVGRRLRLPLLVVAVAAAFYLLNLVLQQPVFLSLRPLVAGAGPFVIGAIATPAVYAVSEEVLRRLSWRAGSTMRNHRTSNGAIVAGLAWGGTESLVLTAALLTGVATTGITAGTLAAFAVGRVCAIATHVGFAHLSVWGYRRTLLFLPLTIVAHFVVDTSVFGLTAVLDPSSAWPGVLFGAFAVGAVLVSVRLRRQWASDTESDAQLSEQRS